MTPEELRADVPALSEVAYLNTGASGPSPTRVVEAATACLERQAYDAPATGDIYESAYATYDRAREAVARLVGADPGDIALTANTVDGVNRVLAALDWEPGDAVVRTDLEHPAGVLPLERLGRRGVDTDVVETDRGRLDVDRIADAAANARLVVLSAVTWTHGTRLPVADVVDVAHDAGARVLVDAVQVPGQAPLDVGEWGADFVAASGHKWLLGPWGSGFLYLDPEAAAALEPGIVGYRGVDEDGDGGFHSGARQFEVGTASPAPYAGLAAAVETIEAVGIDAIQARIADLVDRLKRGVGEDRLVSPTDSETGLVSFAVDDPERFVADLAADDVVVRALPTGAVRASLHAFNTAGEVDAVLSHLPE